MTEFLSQNAQYQEPALHLRLEPRPEEKLASGDPGDGGGDPDGGDDGGDDSQGGAEEEYFYVSSEEEEYDPDVDIQQHNQHLEKQKEAQKKRRLRKASENPRKAKNQRAQQDEAFNQPRGYGMNYRQDEEDSLEDAKRVRKVSHNTLMQKWNRGQEDDENIRAFERMREFNEELINAQEDLNRTAALQSNFVKNFKENDQPRMNEALTAQDQLQLKRLVNEFDYLITLSFQVSGKTVKLAKKNFETLMKLDDKAKQSFASIKETIRRPACKTKLTNLIVEMAEKLGIFEDPEAVNDPVNFYDGFNDFLRVMKYFVLPFSRALGRVPFCCRICRTVWLVNSAKMKNHEEVQRVAFDISGIISRYPFDSNHKILSAFIKAFYNDTTSGHLDQNDMLEFVKLDMFGLILPGDKTTPNDRHKCIDKPLPLPPRVLARQNTQRPLPAGTQARPASMQATNTQLPKSQKQANTKVFNVFKPPQPHEEIAQPVPLRRDAPYFNPTAASSYLAATKPPGQPTFKPVAKKSAMMSSQKEVTFQKSVESFDVESLHDDEDQEDYNPRELTRVKTNLVDPASRIVSPHQPNTTTFSPEPARPPRQGQFFFFELKDGQFTLPERFVSFFDHCIMETIEAEGPKKTLIEPTKFTKVTFFM